MEAAVRRGISPVIIEKDFWVCWTRGILFLAKPGTFRLVPPDYRVPELRGDYQAMREMFLNDPPPFDIILEKLHELENRINQIA